MGQILTQALVTKQWTKFTNICPHGVSRTQRKLTRKRKWVRRDYLLHGEREGMPEC